VERQFEEEIGVEKRVFLSDFNGIQIDLGKFPCLKASKIFNCFHVNDCTDSVFFL
jgi:hypothetical protein